MGLLDIDCLSIVFHRYRGALRREHILGVKDVSFGVERGELVALIGASGAGKSLIAHAILNNLPGNAHVAGDIHFEGASLRAGIAGVYGRRIGLVPQSIGFLDPLARIGKQVQWAARRAGRQDHASADLPNEALVRFGLASALCDAYPHELSGGMARRVLLAIATIGSPGLVIADEPTTGLDPDNVERVLGDLKSLTLSGAGVLLISHDLEAALKVADRVVALREGVLEGIAPARDFVGAGINLPTDYMRQLWRALPSNAFSNALQASI